MFSPNWTFEDLHLRDFPNMWKQLENWCGWKEWRGWEFCDKLEEEPRLQVDTALLNSSSIVDGETGDCDADANAYADADADAFADADADADADGS